MRKLIVVLLALAPFMLHSQIWKGAGIVWVKTAPSHNPGQTGSWVAIDTLSGDWYEWETSSNAWRQMGDRIYFTGTTGAPNYTPGKQKSQLALNLGDSLYAYQGSWVLLNPGTGASYNSSLTFANDTLSLTDGGGTLKAYIPAGQDTSGYNTSLAYASDTLSVTDGNGTLKVAVPASKAGTNIAISGDTVSLDTLGLVLFKTDQTYSNGIGTLGWDNDYKTLAIGVTTDLDLQVGQNEMYHVLNDTTATLAKGKLVMATGTTGNSGKIKANYFLADGNTHGRYVLGVVAENIANGAEGYVMAFGLVRGINASGSLYGESWVNGDILYAHPDSLGGLTKVRPTSPDEEVVVAIVVSNSSTVGSIFVRPQFPFDIGELGDVKIANPTNGQVLSYNNGIWENGNAGSGVQYSDTTSLIATQYFVTSQGFLEWVDTATLATQYYVDSQGFLEWADTSVIATQAWVGGQDYLQWADTSTLATQSFVGSQGYLTAEVDGSTTNEIQLIDTLAIVSDSLRVSLNNNGAAYSAVSLGTYKQTLSIASDKSTLTISNGNTISIPIDTFPIATFGGGSGVARDTAVFSTSSVYGSFYNDGTDTIVVTSMRIGLQGTSPSVVVDVIYNDTLNVTGTKLVTAGSTATNTAGGTSVTAFDQTKIPPGNWVWAKTPTVTTKPTYMSITIIGYRKRKA